MVGKILLTLVSFILFLYVFFFKMFKKNDTNYMFVLGIQTIGIIINFIQIIFGALNTTFFNMIIWLFTIIIPILVFALEEKNINVSEWIYISRSIFYSLCGNEKKSKILLIKLSEKYDNSYYAHKKLAETYEKEGGMRKAIEEYVMALDIRNDDYKSYYRISTLLNDLGKKDEAVEMLLNLLKTKPDHMEASKLLGVLLIEKEQYKKAIKVYNAAIKYNENPEIIYDLALAYIKVNDFSLAKKCFEKIVEIDNKYYKAYFRLGQIALLYRDFDSAEQYFLNSCYSEKESKSYYELAKIYIMKNQRDKAVLSIQKAIDLNSKYYKMLKEEPILFPIKQFIKKPESEVEENIEETKKEKEIEDYLNDTYKLTKILNDQEVKTDNSIFNSNKKKK